MGVEAKFKAEVALEGKLDQALVTKTTAHNWESNDTDDDAETKFKAEAKAMWAKWHLDCGWR